MRPPQPPLVLPRLRRRPRVDGARVAARRIRGGRAGRPAGAEEAALPGQGQVGHLPVHGRRAEPPGTVRQQAASSPSSTASCRRRSCSRATGPRSSTRTRSSSGRSSSSPSTARAAPSCRELLPHLATVVDDIAIVKSMETDAFNHAPAQIFMNTGSPAVRPAEHGLVGDLRPRQRIEGPARLRRLLVRQQGARAAATRTGAAASCRPSTRACCSARPATRCCSCPTRRGSTPRRRRDSLDAIKKLNEKRLDVDRRPGDRHADQLVRDGLPDADRAPRS